MAVWYCCSCGDGPHNTTFPQCSNCGHARCGGCSVADEGHESAPYSENSSSECCNILRKHWPSSSPAPAPTPFTSRSNHLVMSEPAPPHTVLTQNGLKYLAAFAENTPEFLKPLQPADIEDTGIPSTYPSQSHPAYTPQQHGKPGEKEYIWFCCQCSDGPFNCQIQTGCSDCDDGHRRCDHCTVMENSVAK